MSARGRIGLTNYAGDRIAEAFVLDGGTPVEGSKPYATVTKIILPAQTGSPQSVSVGYTNRLGLQMPIAGDADVIQIGRKASAATSYTIETLTNVTIDENFATVEPSSITVGDSFEFVVEASQ